MSGLAQLLRRTASSARHPDGGSAYTLAPHALDEQFGGRLSVIAVNVEEKSREAQARQVIKEYDLKWPQVMSGMGGADPAWKMFGGMGGGHLAIPLYVLIDREGKLAYAGNGGDDLAELTAVLKQLLGDGIAGARR